MIIPIEKVRTMQQQFAIIRVPAYNSAGFAGSRPLLVEAATEVFSGAFHLPIDPAHITTSCISYEGNPGLYVLVFRAEWSPPMDRAQFVGGRHNGWVQALQFPQSTVTLPSSVGSSEKYQVTGFDTESSNFIFELAQARSLEEAA